MTMYFNINWTAEVREWTRMREEDVKAYIDIYGLNDIKEYILRKIRKIKSYKSVNDRGALMVINNLAKKIEKCLHNPRKIVLRNRN